MTLLEDFNEMADRLGVPPGIKRNLLEVVYFNGAMAAIEQGDPDSVLEQSKEASERHAKLIVKDGKCLTLR